MSQRSLYVPLGLIFSVLLVILLGFTHPGMVTGQSTSPSYPPVPYVAPTSATVAPTATAATATSQPTATTGSGQATTTPRPTAVSQVTPGSTPGAGVSNLAVVPSPTLVPTLPATPTPVGQPACIPGQSMPLTGTGPAFAGFLLFFDDRAVSGGTIGVDGHFMITMAIGMELPGTHRISIRVRGTSQELLSFDCQVPVVTPTPLPPTPVP